MTTKIVVPHFKSEAEEAAWWYEHREELNESHLEAIENGTALRLRDVLWEHGLVLPGLSEVAVKLEDDDVELARQQAAGRGLEYHEYLGKLIHEALRKQEAA